MTAFIFLGNRTLGEHSTFDMLREQEIAAAEVERDYIIPKLEKPTRKAIVEYVEAHPGEIARMVRDKLLAKGYHSWVLGGNPKPEPAPPLPATGLIQMPLLA